MARHSDEVFDSKDGLVQRARQALGWHGPEGGQEAGRTGGSSSGPEAGLRAGFTAGSEGGLMSGLAAGAGTVVQAGNSSGISPGSTPVVHSEPSGPVQAGEQSGVELHVVDGRLIACRPGEPPPLSVRQHTEAFLAWLRAHDKVPGVEVPVAILERVLYWEFLRDTGLPMKPWRTVSDILVKLPGVKKYQADWRSPTGEGPTPVIVKITRPRRAKVVKLAAAERKRA
jgi:hypothetical protein